MILEVERLCVAYGPVVVVRDLDLAIARGASLALLGANGAGKTSTVEALAGLLPKRSGSVRFDARDVTRANASDMPAWAWRSSRNVAICSRDSAWKKL